MQRRTIAGQGHPGDDGSADPGVHAALAAYAAGRGSEHAALLALSASRLLVPVVAVLTEQEDAPAAPGAPGGQEGPRDQAGPHRDDKASEMALPTLIGADGRAALPAFTCLDSLTRWRADARPVPVPAARVWLSATQEASAVVIDVAGPVPLAVDGARLAALARGRPAPPPHEDPDVLALAREVLAGEPAVAAFWLRPGRQDTDLAVCLVPGPAATAGELRAAAGRASASIMAGAGGRVRRGIEIAITQPGAAGPADRRAGNGPANGAAGGREAGTI